MMRVLVSTVSPLTFKIIDSLVDHQIRVSPSVLHADYVVCEQVCLISTQKNLEEDASCQAMNSVDLSPLIMPHVVACVNGVGNQLNDN